MNPITSLDPYDRKILRQLAVDGRMTWSDLSDAIGLSLTPTIRRVKRLEDSGYIRGYSARLDEGLLAGSMSVFTSITLEKQIRTSLDAFEAEVAKLPEVMSGFMMSGGDDYLLRCVVRDLDHYRAFLDTLTKVPGVAHIQSSFALKSFIDRPTPIIR